MSDQESTFYSFMGFDPAYAREVHGFYVPYFQGRRRVLDIACGRGEFLDVLKAAGGHGLGVDLDPGMVEAGRAAGHEVVEADVYDYLPQHEGEFDGIYSAHLVEHLPYERAAELLGLCFRALRPGGRVLFCTPNCDSITTLQRRFWWDATHVRLYDRELLRFMLLERGFAELECGVNPKNLSGCPIDIDALQLPSLLPIDLNKLDNEDKKDKKDKKDLKAQALVDGLVDLKDRVLFLNHNLNVVASTLQGLAQALYVPAEAFATGIRPG